MQSEPKTGSAEEVDYGRPFDGPGHTLQIHGSVNGEHVVLDVPHGYTPMGAAMSRMMRAESALAEAAKERDELRVLADYWLQRHTEVGEAAEKAERERDAARELLREAAEVVRQVRHSRVSYAPNRVYAPHLFNADHIDELTNKIDTSLTNGAGASAGGGE